MSFIPIIAKSKSFHQVNQSHQRGHLDERIKAQKAHHWPPMDAVLRITAVILFVVHLSGKHSFPHFQTIIALKVQFILQTYLCNKLSIRQLFIVCEMPHKSFSITDVQK